MHTTELAKYGVHDYVIEKLVAQGFCELTEVQRMATEAGLFDSRNVLVSAPTNTGKTFIGELAAIVASSKKRNRSFYLVPLKAIADEKFEDFSFKYGEWGLGVAISTSDRTEFDNDLLNYDLIIATYEKLNALIIRNPKLIDDIGLLVVDELQNLGDTIRGPTLEILLTRMLASPNQPQIIGLSATMPNAKEIAEWLNAELVETNKRDIELREGILFHGNDDNVRLDGIKLHSGDFVYREHNTGTINVERNLHIHTLEAIAEISKSEQTIVFTDTQGNSEKSARIISGRMPINNKASKILEQIETSVEPTPSTRTLKDTVMNGVAFHHAGLLGEERRIVERGFREGTIRVICSTTTLGAGVNTPAKNVIILDHETYQGNNIHTRDYKNMAGRAGRIRAKDAFGRSILFAATQKELSFLWSRYIIAHAEPVKSQIASGRNLGTSILGLIACGMSDTKDDLINFIKLSFFGYTYYRQSAENFHKLFDESIEQQLIALEESGLVSRDDQKVSVTELGKRCGEELLLPSTAVTFAKTLRSREMEISKPYSRLTQGIIHLCCCTDNGENALLFEPKTLAEKEELQALWEVNSSDFFAAPEAPLAIRALRTTRMLLRWIEGAPYPDLRQYAAAGIIKRDAETISWLLRGLAKITEKPVTGLGSDFSEFISNLSERVFYGVPLEALEIMRMKIPSVHRGRAVALAQAGLGTLEKLISASVEEIDRVDGIGEKLALRIKQHIENYIDSETQRSFQSQLRRAKELGRDAGLLQRLYSEKGDDFARIVTEIFKVIGLDAVFVGESARHGIDILVNTSEGAIVIECKRIGKGCVSAGESEQILGRGEKHNPISRVTVGHPYFSREAIDNAKNTKVTLLRGSMIGEMIISFWNHTSTKENVIATLKSGVHVTNVSQNLNSIEYR